MNINHHKKSVETPSRRDEEENKMGTYKTFLTAVILAAVLTGSGYTQSNSIKDITAHKYALNNLIAGIHSENDGVRRNSIYFAGYYKIVEAEDALIAQLKEEKDPSTRILISLVLFELGSEEGLLEVKDLSLNDKDAKVRRMSTQIYSEYLVNDAASTVYVTE
jgi:HEAT repeat protein